MALNSISVDDFKKDILYSEFMSDSYNLQNSISLIKNFPFNEQLAKISSGIEYVKHNISQLTAQNCESFFSQTSKLDLLYEELRFISVKSQNLSKTLELMKVKLEVPYQQLYRQIILISRLQKTCDLLRKMLRIMHLVKRIDECSINSLKDEQAMFLKEILKISQYVNEIDLLIISDSQQLSKLSFINKNLEKIEKVKDKITKDADGLLIIGLENADFNIISTSLQVYHNLNILNTKLSDLTGNKCNLICQTATKSLTDLCHKEQFRNNLNKDISSTSQYNMLSSHLRSSIKSCLEFTHNQFCQVMMIMKVLKKKRDNATQSLLIDYIDNKHTLMADFWNDILKILSQALNKFINEHLLLKSLFESEYPKILVIFSDYWNKILHDDGNFDNEKPLRSVISQHESAFLSNSLSVLFDCVNKVFSDAKESNRTFNSKIASVPSEKDIDAIVKEISIQLTISNVDSQLINCVCKNILKTVNLFMVKCEHLTLVDGEATQVIGPFTTSQRHNSLIIHILNYFSNKMLSAVNKPEYSEYIQQTVQNSLKSLDVLILNIMEPFMNSVQDSIEAIILTAHNEQFNISRELKPEERQCSLYMKELQRFILRVSNDYFKQFPRCDVIQKRIFQTASKTIDLFLLHNCLLSPVSNSGRLKISTDFNQLETAILPICQRMGDLGRSFQIFKAFQTILFLPPEGICNSRVIGDPVPYYYIMHYLVSNYGSNELMLPHKFKGWSITRYSQWITERSNEEQRLTLINETLDDHVKQVKKTQKKTFATIYPLLVDLMKKALIKNGNGTND